VYQSNYYMYYGAKSYVGSIYSYDFSDSSVRNILSSTDGGCNKTVGSAFTSTSFSTASWADDGGMIKPFGGFLSANRDFFYICTRGAVNATDYRDGSLIGINVRSLDTTQNINGHTDGRAFRVGGFNTYNGFLDAQYYLCYYGIGYYYYYPGYSAYLMGSYGETQKVAATDNGWVYFVSGTSTGSYSTGQSSSYGGSRNSTYYAYPYNPKALYVFDPNVGGDVQEVASSAAWSAGASYTVVGCLETSDDGSSVASVYSTQSYYSFNDRESLSVWTGVELDASGDMVGAPTRMNLESTGYVSAHIAFGSKVQDLFYAQGSSNENSKVLKRASFESGATTNYAFQNANYNVLHVGR
jgi:hypothetical protein